MGMFDFLKKNKAAADLPEAPANTLLAVQNGKIVPVDTLPDPVFAEKVLGDGYAIDPTDGKVLVGRDIADAIGLRIGSAITLGFRKDRRHTGFPARLRH